MLIFAVVGLGEGQARGEQRWDVTLPFAPILQDLVKVELEAEPTKGEEEDPEGNDDELDTNGLTNVNGVRGRQYSWYKLYSCKGFE